MPRFRVAVLVIALTPVASSAQGSPGMRITGPPTIPPLVLEDATRILNAPGSRRLAAGSTVAAQEVVATDAVAIDGAVTVAGHIRGRLVAINSDVRFLAGATVDSGLIALGGSVTGRADAVISGDVHLYPEHVTVERDAPAENEDASWWRRRERWRKRSWTDLRFVSARTYNRVEGLPVLIGPAFGRDLGWGRLTIDAFAVVRSVGKFAQTSENLGHSVRTELRFGRDYGVRVGGRQYDLVEGVEPWALSDAETGLSAFLFRRDFRDYFNVHGGALFGGFYVRKSLDLGFAYSDERWSSRAAKNALSLFRNNQPWRENPAADEGTFHRLQATARFDTRNDSRDPWSGWFVTGEYEFGTGTISRYAPASIGVRHQTMDGHNEYDRLFLDVRRYNRLSPDAQLNARVVMGGWLSGDDLPLQRRFSVGGPGTLPGYGFRENLDGTDVLQCAPSPPASSSLPRDVVPGIPAQCERMILAQLEFRGDLRIDPFDLFTGERSNRRRGWGRSAEWVVFVDAGRGWLVGTREARLQYPTGMIPPLGTFRADIGAGLRLDDLGLYVARGVSEGGRPFKFFVRLRPRF